MDIFNSILSILLHVGIFVSLVIYIPISFLWRLVLYIFAKPFRCEDMRGKVVLITGASSGLGEQLAYQYAKRGASLALVARREAALNAVAKNARAHGAPEVLVIRADVSCPNESERIVEETVANFGQLDHLVANAGIASSCLFEEITNISAFTQVMDVNFWGAVYPTYYAIPHLKKSRGKIVVMASIAGRVPLARLAFYNASKAAMIPFYEMLRAELGSEVRITILTPGFFSSEFTEGKFLDKGGEMKIDEEARDVRIGFFPIARAEKFAEVIMDCTCRGDEYATWPSWYRPFYAVMFVAPEVINWFSRLFYVAEPGAKTLGKRILEVPGVKKFLYQSIKSQDTKFEIKD